MKYLSTGVDPECDKPAGLLWDEDLDAADLKGITGLYIGKKTQGLSSVSGCKRIKYLTTTHWTTETAEFVRTLPGLSHLHISRVRGPIVDAGKLPRLKILSLFACPGLDSLQPFAGCKALESLWISGCIKFKALEGLKHFDRLSELEMIGSMAKSNTLDSLASLSNCKSLVHVGLAASIKDKDLSALHKLKSLKHLWLQNRFKREQYEAVLAACPKLRKIDLHNGTFDRQLGFQRDTE